MSSDLSKKSNYSKKILKILVGKPAVPVEIITSPLTPLLNKGEGQNANSKYALTRSLKNLIEAGYIETHNSDNQKYLKITKKGNLKLNSIKLEGEDSLVSNTWDGFWRIIILDLAEERKNEREALRYLLKKANFVCIKNTVWISPHPYEYLFTNIKKDLSLSTELMIIVTDKIDEDTKKVFLESIKG